MDMTEEMFFDDEVILTSDGLYSVKHELVNDQNQIVVLVGELHIGTKGYLDRLLKNLSLCDLVLFEGCYENKNDQDEHFSGEDILKNTDKKDDDLNLLFKDLFLSLMSNTMNINGLEQVSEIKKHQEGWEHVDIGFNEDVFLKIENELDERVAKIDTEKKKRIINWITKKIERIDEKKFQLREIGDIYRVLYGGNGIADLFLNSSLCVLRNNYLVDTLLQKLKEKPDLRKVGVLYGAAHMADIKTKLLKSNFRIQGSNRILGIYF